MNPDQAWKLYIGLIDTQQDVDTGVKTVFKINNGLANDKKDLKDNI